MVLIVDTKRGNGEGARNPGAISEDDLAEIWIIDEDIGDGHPNKKLLALDPCEAPHSVLFHEGGDFFVVGDSSILVGFRRSISVKPFG